MNCTLVRAQDHPPLPAHADVQGSEAINLERAVALAKQYHYRLNITREEVTRTIKLIDAKRTEGLPNLRAIALPGWEAASPYKFNYGFIGLAMQPITQLYKVRLGLDIAHLEKDQAKQTVRLTLQQAVNEVKLTYYLILEREEAIKSIEDQIKYLTELVHVVEGLVVQGAALDVDLLEVRTRLAGAEFEAENQRDLLATDKDQLNHLMGRDPRIPFSVIEVPMPDESELDMSKAEALALKQRPELQQQQILVQKILAHRKLVLEPYIPDVSFGLTSIQSKNFKQTFPPNFVSFGFLANYEIYDWNRKGFLAQADSVQAREERLHLSDLIDQVLVDVRDKCRQLRLAKQRLNVASMRKDTAQERLRVDTRRLKFGATLLSQVLDSEATLANANRQYTDSVLALWSAKSELDRAIGKDFN
jgi:outer membrane protein TolC